MNERKIVLPGELLGERLGRKIKNVYVEDGNVYSKVLGVARINDNEINVIPLAGKYMPKVGDRIVGIISSVEVSGWFVDINSPYKAFLPVSEAVEEFVDVSRSDLSRYFDVGDILFCKVSKVTKNKIIQVTMRDMLSRKLYKGITIKITPMKVGRVIGKGGSMVQLIKKKTGCDIYVGQNGVIWIRGKDKAKAIKAILTIEKEAHTVGLTEKIDKMLGEENG